MFEFESTNMVDSIIERAIPEDVQTVPLVDLPLAMVVITSTFVFICLLSNSTRAYVKITARAVGLDDCLVLFSQVRQTASLIISVNVCRL